MYTCVDNKRRQFFISCIRDPPKRNQPIVEFLSREPWREILKNELSYDSDDENCTIVKTLKQDRGNKDKAENTSKGTDEESVLSRLECWHKLKELTYYLPELKCILNDVNYAGPDERPSSHETCDDVNGSKQVMESKLERVSENDIPINVSLTDIEISKDTKPNSDYVEPLHDVLYRNECFAKILDGIVHKEILELINFDGELDYVDPKLCLEKKKSGYKSFESYLFKIETGDADEDSRVSHETPGIYRDLDEAAQEQLDYLLEESSTIFEAQLEEQEKSREKSTVDFESDKPKDLVKIPPEYVDSSDISSVSVGEGSSDDISNADELLNELLGSINYQDVIEEWKNAKREKQLKAQQVVKILEPKKTFAEEA